MKDLHEHFKIENEKLQTFVKHIDIGCWTSNTSVNTNFKKWNTCVTNTNNQLFELKNNQKDVIVKKSGIFRILAIVGCHGVTTKHALLYVNNTPVCAGKCHTSQINEYQQVTMNYVAKLEINSIINVQTCNSCDHSLMNVLTVERVGE